MTAAGDTGRAAHQWLKAGRHAAAQSAYLEAIAHLERGLGILHSLPESPARDGCEIDLQLALAGCLLTTKGAVAAKIPYMRAFDLAESSGSQRQRFEALYGVWQSTNMSGGSAANSPLSARLLRERARRRCAREFLPGRLQTAHVARQHRAVPMVDRHPNALAIRIPDLIPKSEAIALDADDDREKTYSRGTIEPILLSIALDRRWGRAAVSFESDMGAFPYFEGTTIIRLE